MKTSIKNLLVLPLLTSVLGLLPALPVTAQTFTVLHSFSALPYPSDINSDGGGPGRLALSGNTLYGTALSGGSSGYGTVFKLNADGTGFVTLHSFAALPDSSVGPNADGAQPVGLVISGNTLYGTTQRGGSLGWGTVFALNTDGTGFKTLYTFTGGSDEGYPAPGLILSNNTLYGSTQKTAQPDWGTVFAINTDGTGFTTLYSFSGGSDGGGPAGLVLSGNSLYGVTDFWTSGLDGTNWGTVFAINTDGTGFTTVHSFTEASNSNGSYTNSDGVYPAGVLILSSNMLVGTARYGGSAGVGTVFSVNTDGTGFTTLTNLPEWEVRAFLVLSGNTLYGTGLGNAGGAGSVFAVNTDETGFTTLHNFSYYSSDPRLNNIYTNSDGGALADLILSGNTLYGTAGTCGRFGQGTIFSLTLPGPQLTLTPSGPNVILTWPTNAMGFFLQSTTSLGSSSVWSTNAPPPTVVNGLNTVTNAITGTQQFFRLGQ